MTTPDRGALNIPVTSADATVQYETVRSAKENARARFLRARGLSADPVPTPTPAPKTRRRLVVKNPQPDVSSSSVRPAGDPKPGRGVVTRPASASAAPPGADEVRMSRREFEAVLKAIDVAVAKTVSPAQHSALGITVEAKAFNEPGKRSAAITRKRMSK